MKAKNFALLLGISAIFYTYQAQEVTKDNMTITNSANIPLVRVDTKVKDSLIAVANRNIDVAINYTTKIPQKKQELINIKMKEQEAMKEYISAVDKFLKQSGRTEKIAIKSSLKNQLQKGEIFLVKDSVCAVSKKRFLGKPKCIQWKYNFYLQDKDGNKEKLF